MQQPQPRRLKMEIILLERIEKLGQMGDLVKVKDGYARNFLLPQKKALLATKDNRTKFDTEREALQRVNDDKRTVAESAANSLNGKDFVLIRQAGDTSQLFGSVSARDIATSISETGVALKRQQVRLDAPIKTLGIHDVSVVLHPEVTISVRINVARSKEEADIQLKGGTVNSDIEDSNESNNVDTSLFDTEEAASNATEKLVNIEEGNEIDTSSENVETNDSTIQKEDSK